MQVTAEQTNPCTIVLDIEVDEAQVARTFDSVYREFSRYVNVPGFRPGKAPRAILERYVNQEKLQQRALEKVVTDTYKKAIEEQALTPYRDPQIEPGELKDKAPFTYKATIPLEPQISLGEYTNLTIEKPVFPITEEMIERRIQAIREEHARLERVTDRGLENGDVAIAEQSIVIEGEEAKVPRRQLIQIGNNIPGYDEAVAGMMPNEERSFTLTYPDDYDEEDKRGKEANYTIKLSSISAKRLPELTDEFVKELHMDAGTVDEFRAELAARMQTEASNLSDEIAEQRLVMEVINRAQINFPEVLVLEEAEDELRRLSNQLKQREMSYDAYLAQVNMTREAHQERVKQEAAARVSALLALRQVATQEDLQTTDEEIDEEFARLLSAGKITEDQYNEYLPVPERRFQVANAIVQERLHKFLFEHNTIVETEQKDPDAVAELADPNGDVELAETAE